MKNQISSLRKAYIKFRLLANLNVAYSKEPMYTNILVSLKVSSSSKIQTSLSIKINETSFYYREKIYICNL